MKRCALVFLCLLALPTAAEGRPFNTGEMRAVEVAHDYWQRGPACESITYDALPSETIGDTGRALGSCRLQIADDLPWITACTVVTHEWGHMIGYALWRHDPSLGAIMSESPDPTRQCLREDDRRVYRAKRKACGRKRGVPRKRCVRRARRAAFGY